MLFRSGRVNREGNYTDAQVWSFCIYEDGILIKNKYVDSSANILRKYYKRNIQIHDGLVTSALKEEFLSYDTSDSLSNRLLKNEAYQQFKSVEKDFQVIDNRSSLAVVDSEIMERITTNNITWYELQKHSVAISETLLSTHHIPTIKNDIYYWNIGYDSFMGYMAAIVPPLLKKIDSPN